MKALSIIALGGLVIGAAAVSLPAQAGESCYNRTCYSTSYHQYDVPFPSWQGDLISHFDSAGAPHSLVTPSDSDTHEVPCPPRQKKM